MTGIFYFSSTGNSLYIAKKINEKIKGKVLYIPKYDGNGSEFERIIIVSPIYSYGLPVHTYNFISTLSANIKTYIVLNYGGMVGGADVFAYNLSKDKNLNICGVYAIRMPENYTLTFSTPKFYSNKALRNAPKKIARILKEIKSDKIFIPKQRKTKEKIYNKNKKNWHLIAKDFSVTADCIKCGKCVSLCPADNIAFDNGKIVFLDNCVACLGCYHRCPQKAILYKNRKKKDRYINPLIIEELIGKNL